MQRPPTIDEPIRILHVDDQPEFAEMVATSLEREDDRFIVTTVSSASEALECLDIDRFDCIVSDYDMPGQNGIEFLNAVREEYPDLPFILFTGKGSEAIASDAISSGVTDYLQKQPGSEQYALLANRITNAVEQARAERELQEERHRFQILFERLTQATVEVEYEGSDPIVRRVNPAFEAIFGYDADEIVGTSLDAYIVPDEYEAEAADINQRVRDEGRLISEEVTRMTADGPRTFLLQNAVYDDGSGGFAIYTDITDRKERERELEQYQTIVEAAPDPIAVVDPDGYYQYVNPAFSRLTEYDEETLLGKHFTLIKPDEEADRTEEALDRLMTTDEMTTVRSETLLQTTADRSIICEDHMAALSKDNEPRGAVIIHRDVTERVVREEQVERERDRFTTLFENLPVPVVHGELIDGEPIIRTVNRQFERVFGYDATEAEHENLDELTAPPDREDEAMTLNRKIIEEGYLHEEVRRQTADGVRDFDLRAVLRTETDPPEGYAIYTDITERKERERELQRQNERLDEFASLVSHDLRNPLNVAEGHLELAKNECDSESLDAIKRALDRMETLIDDLLALAREGEPVTAFEPVDLAELAERCWQTVGIEAATLHIETDHSIKGDASRLQQLLENLFRNAVEHGGDDVTVRIGHLDDGNGFYVADDGQGIPEDERERVFESGYSTSEQGTGFGLTIVNEIVEAHGWEITITDSATGGARFEITGVEFDGE
ncbi:MAG: PAS domain S-box protein [Halobacteriales archaeon]